MALPDVSRFERLSFGELAALGDRLRALGLTPDGTADVMRICDGLFDPLRLPMRRYHLRQRADPLAAAMRLFLLKDAIPRDAARAVLGELPLEPYVSSGLLVELEDDRLVSPLHLNLIGPLLVLCDDLTHAGDAVMGAANTTADLCRAARPRRCIARALDVGCGAGTLALCVAPHAERVIATDVNPRALVVARVNAALNRVENVEFRLGDLFAPVEGERFDLVVSQPPFVPRPEGSAETTYLYGGARGDELPSRVLGAVSSFLTPGGRAVLLVKWPTTDDTPHEVRVRELVRDPSVSLLLLASTPIDLDEWCTMHAAIQEGSIGEPFTRRATALRAHLDRVGIRGMQMAFTVLQRGPAPAFTRRLDILPTSRARVSSAHVDALLATSALIEAPDDVLLDADVCLPDGAELVERQGRFRVQFAELLAPIELSRPAALLVAATEEAANVREAVAKVLADLEQGEEMTSSALSGVRQALALGVLEVAPRAASEARRC